MPMMQTRRRFLSGAALAGTAGFLRVPRAWAAERELETTTVRLAKIPVICFAPQYVCEALLRAEGFTDIRYVDTPLPTMSKDLGRGRFDFASALSLDHITAIDAGAPITILTGVHAGCYEPSSVRPAPPLLPPKAVTAGRPAMGSAPRRAECLHDRSGRNRRCPRAWARSGRDRSLACSRAPLSSRCAASGIGSARSSPPWRRGSVRQCQCLWSCGRRVSVVQAQRQIHRVLLAACPSLYRIRGSSPLRTASLMPVEPHIRSPLSERLNHNPSF
jgi:hypothetical protein